MSGETSRDRLCGVVHVVHRNKKPASWVWTPLAGSESGGTVAACLCGPAANPDVHSTPGFAPDAIYPS